MPKAPLPEAAMALLREPNPAVISMVMPSGHPMSVATWYLVEEWYTHVSVRGPVVRWEYDEATALADIDRLSRHYGGGEFRNRSAKRVSAWIEITHWHGWEID